MSRANTSTYILPILFFVFAFCLSNNGVHAFGAGNIPSFAYMEGKAFRHGDIEDVLEDLAKGAGGFALVNLVGKSRKFNGLDIKRVYFGNWLRDYSQAVDIATLKKMPLQTILNLLLVLGFMAHGYATNEFEITEERLGCYLPTEHIDNPKGYGDGEDARKYHPGLRGPVDPRELEIDPRTGMKNYIANETGGWDTSKALIRRLLEKCIHLGRLHHSNGNKADQYEAYRLLGTALHTLEDFPAHSNFCELALIRMGHHNVFTHVGDHVRVHAPGGKQVAPIVTGTFGSDDFFHSLLGGASDSLSEASVSDLNKEIDKARSRSADQARSGGGSGDPADSLRLLFASIPGGDGQELSRELDNVQRVRAGTATGGKTPEQMSPKELHATLWQVLVFRDSVAKKISKTIEKIPGLGPLIDKLMDSISVFVFTTIEPFMKPILQSATGGLHSVSAEVIDKHDQYEVFNDPRASDPTHSFLSKDHFNLILNEPAGLVAKVMVVNAVQLIAKAWEDTNINPHQIIEEITESLFHPDFHNSSSKVQREMLKCMDDWVRGLHDKNTTIGRLSKDSVRKHMHTRTGGEASAPVGQGGFAAGHAHQFQGKVENYAATHIPGGSHLQGVLGGFGSSSGPARGVPGGGEAASYYNNAPEGYNTSRAPPAHQPAMPHSPPAFGGGPPEPPSGHAGYSPSYASQPPGYGALSHNAPSFPGGPPSFPGAAAPPSFPGADYHSSFPGGPSSPPPSFPGAAPAFPGAPGGYDTGYGGPPPPHGGAPGFPGAAPSFPGASPGFPGAEPYGQGQHGHGHHGQWGGY